MSLLLWIGIYVGITSMCVWFVLDEGTMAEALFGLHTAEWADRTVQVFAGVIWLAATIWFAAGLFDEAYRI